MKVGVVVGRFQTDTLHKGHISLLEYVLEECDLLCVVVGVSENLLSRRNPLDFPTRKQLVEGHLNLLGYGGRVVVLPHADHSSDATWSANLDRLLRQTFPCHALKLYGARDSFLKAYTGRLPTQDVTKTFGAILDESATSVREAAARLPEANHSFRKGVIYGAYNQWPRVFMCVDVAVLDGESLLMGKRKDEPHCRFFGGFVDQRDSGLEAAAYRELKEESGIPKLLVPRLRYVSSEIVKDYRYAHTDDGVLMTSLFLAEVRSQADIPLAPNAGDDIDSLVRLPLDKTRGWLDEQVMPNHRPLMDRVLAALAEEGQYHG